MWIVCRRCGSHCRTTCVAAVQQGGNIGCFCSGRALWNTEEGWHRIHAIIAERTAAGQIDIDVDTMTLEWWKANITGVTSTLLAKCRRCSQICRDTSINSFRKGAGFGCLCRNKTEAKFFHEIMQESSSYPLQTVILSPSPGKWRPEWSKSNRDFGIRLHCGTVVNEEMDGPQHFRAVLWSWGSISDPAAQAMRDGENCHAACAAGVWVVRYYQQDVITERVHWRAYRRACHSYITEHATESPRVIVPASNRSIYEDWAVLAAIDLCNVIFL